MGSLYYRSLLAQPQRLSAMHDAIRAAVGPGDVVVEIGTGVGTYAVMAARAGASTVYAIEPDRVAEVAAKVFEVNGVEDRVVLIRQRVEEVELPRKADLLISEDFAPWFFDEHLHDLLLYSRRQVLKEGGKIIPTRITLRAAPWGGPGPGTGQGEGEDSGAAGSRWSYRPGSPDLDLGGIEGIDFTPLEELVLNTPDPEGVPPGGPLAEGKDLFGWDLARLEPGTYPTSVTWTVTRPGTVWGLGVWMEMTLWTGIHYSNAPHAGEMSWGQGHFPLTPPLPVEEGTVLEGEVETRTDPYGVVWWQWAVQIEGKPSTRREANTFKALPLGDSRRRSLAEGGRLPLSRWAAVDAYMLGELQEKSLQQVAADARQRFPELLVDEARARRRACYVRERYITGDEPNTPPEKP